MSEPARLHVSFRKAVSDGNYGTESAEATVEIDLLDHEDPADELSFWLREMRAHVHLELSNSPSSAVRRALEPPKPRPSVDVDEFDEVRR